MPRPYRHIEVDKQQEEHCIRLRGSRMDEADLEDLFAELTALVEEEGCRRMLLLLGPEAPVCLYSMFLPKLLRLNRLLKERGGELLLCNASDSVRNIFATCHLDHLFHFVPDLAAAPPASS